MDPQYKFIHSVDPSKVKVKIKDKFAKVTLSSNKKQQDKQDEDEPVRDRSACKSASRNLMADLLTDDDSDNEMAPSSKQSTDKVPSKHVNRLLQTDSSPSSSDNIYAGKIVEVNDLDSTNCSQHLGTDKNNIEIDDFEKSTEMERLQFTLSQMSGMENSISAEHPVDVVNHRDMDTIVDQLSQKVSSLSVKSMPMITISSDESENHQEASRIISTESQRLSTCYRNSPKLSTTNAKEQSLLDPEITICLLSTPTISEPGSAITISDSASSCDVTTDYELQTSEIPISGETADAFLADTFSNEKADRMEAFLRDVSALRKELQGAILVDTVQSLDGATLPVKCIARADTEAMSENNSFISSGTNGNEVAMADTESMIPEQDVTMPSPVVHQTKRTKETDQITNADLERLKLALNDTEPMSVTNVSMDAQLPPSPAKRLALDDTEAMTNANVKSSRILVATLGDVLASDLVNESIINNSMPDDSLTIAETSSEVTEHSGEGQSVVLSSSSSPAQIQSTKQSSSSQLQSNQNSSSSLSRNSSEVQMSIGSVNISAKINIKIHISQQVQLETSSEGDSSDSSYDSADDESHKQEKANPESEKQQNGTAMHEKKTLNPLIDDCSSPISCQSNNSMSPPRGDSLSSQSNFADAPAPGKSQTNNCMLTPNLTVLVPSRSPLADAKSQNKNYISTPKRSNSVPSKSSSTDAPSPGKSKNKNYMSPPSRDVPVSPSVASVPDKSPKKEDEIFLQQAQKMLDQLYGNAWRTPDVIRTLKKTSGSKIQQKTTTKIAAKKLIKSPTGANAAISPQTNGKIVRDTEESVLDDFSIFRRNIKTDLDSTRFADPTCKKTIPIKSVGTDPRPRRREGPRRDADEENKFKVPQTEVKSRTTTQRGRQVRERWRNLIDDDSTSNEENASDDDDDDDSWNKSDSSNDNSDSDLEVKTKKPITKKITATRQRKPKSPLSTSKAKDEIVYLDLSKHEVEVQEDWPSSPPVNHDTVFDARLKNILQTCKYEDKPKLQPTPKGISKRKLFTANFGDEDENSPKTPDWAKPTHFIYDDDCPISGDLENIRLNPPVNKQLESVKMSMPIFKIPTPKTAVRGTPTSKAKKTIFKTPQQASARDDLISTPKAAALRIEDVTTTTKDKYNFLKSLDVCVGKSLCHPDALYYRDNYRQKKEELAQKLYTMFNEKLFNNKLNVSLVWNKKLLNTAGRCVNKKKMGTRTSLVELSEKVLTSADRLRCTLIHELCHAATWIFDGESGHGATWKAWARKANTIFPEIPKISRCHQYDIEYKYTYKCTLCAAKSHAHSKSKKVENIRCSYCHGAIEVFLNKKDKDGNILPTPVKEATGFAKFVKDKYKQYKRPDLKHADVMKLLSNEFASLKMAGDEAANNDK